MEVFVFWGTQVFCFNFQTINYRCENQISSRKSSANRDNLALYVWYCCCWCCLSMTSIFERIVFLPAILKWQNTTFGLKIFLTKVCVVSFVANENINILFDTICRKATYNIVFLLERHNIVGFIIKLSAVVTNTRAHINANILKVCGNRKSLHLWNMRCYAILLSSYAYMIVIRRSAQK